MDEKLEDSVTVRQFRAHPANSAQSFKPEEGDQREKVLQEGKTCPGNGKERRNSRDADVFGWSLFSHWLLGFYQNSPRSTLQETSGG